ncbi:lactonase family protein [Krasilnikovia sp. M28-CT-15]|uniref:lactonase family protein n=1 Tax=Krasilnikovia sp. M28-CT-15 TaxID=3373540 RepID=UPI0038761330
MAGGASWARRGRRPVARPGRTRRGLRAGLVLLVALCLAGLGLLPTSLAAFSATTSGPASSFTARATFGLTQTATPPCLNDNGSGGCAAATGIIQGESVVISPDGKNVYVGSVGSSTNSGVAEFSRNATTGALTQLGGNDKCASNGTVTGCTPFPGALYYVYDLAISPDGKHVYATGFASDTIVSFSRNASTGALTPIAGVNKCLYDSTQSSPPANCNPAARHIDGADGVVVSPDGAFVYVTSYNSDSLTVYARDATTGALTQLAGTAGCITNTSVSNCALGVGLNMPDFVRMSPDGTSLYVTSNKSSTVAVFQRNPTTGVLTQAADPNACLYDTAVAGINGCKAATGISGAYYVAIAPNGRTAYVTGKSGDTIAQFTRNTSTGVLTQLASPNACLHLSGGSAPPGCGSSARGINGPTWVTFSDDGLFAFVSAASSYAVAAFRHNNTTGVLTQITGTSGCISNVGSEGCAAGSALKFANALTISPDGRDVYVVGGDTQGSDEGYLAVLNATH